MRGSARAGSSPGATYGRNGSWTVRVEPTVTSLISRLVAAGESGRGVTFVVGGTPDEVSWAVLHDQARQRAAALAELGVRPGDHVALLGPTSRELVTTIQAVWLAGAATVVLPLPMRLGSLDEFVAQTKARIRNADAVLVVVDPSLASFVGDPVPGEPPTVGFAELPAASAGQWRPPQDDPDRIAILQFTSGSTSDPKGVVVPDRALVANLDAITVAAHIDPATDVLVSWLPLYHDMGLVGLLTNAMASGCGLVLAAPTDFMGAPGRWMEWISTYGGTATAGPNFSYVLATRALRRGGSPLDLSSLRLALNGAEPVDPDAMDAFVEAGAPHGLSPSAVFPAFGMAEVAIAGTFPEPGSGMRTDRVDRRVLETERYAAPVASDHPNSRRLAVLGRAVPGLEIRICDSSSGDVLAEREVGELEIRGTSVTPGYYRRPDLDGALFHEGWLRTGDLGYLVDGELVMCGRIKDMIIVGGRNVFPEDVERALVDVEGVRAGNVIAFGVDGARGKEGLVVVAESKHPEPSVVRRLVADRVRAAIGLPARDVVLVAPGTLPKTSSGKLQRTLCKARYLDDGLDALEPV